MLPLSAAALLLLSLLLPLQSVDDANLMNVKAQFFLKDQFGAALAALTYGKSAASIASLYAVQAFLDTVLFPKGACM